MSELDEIAERLNKHIRNDRSCCVMPSDGGHVGESSLMGTRDGYLRLIVSLLTFVADTDAGRAEIDEETGACWDDRFKQAILQLPNNDGWLVGAYLFESETEMMDALRKFTEWDGVTANSIDHDRDFRVEQKGGRADR
jgi:hypothetical protein